MNNNSKKQHPIWDFPLSIKDAVLTTGVFLKKTSPRLLIATVSLITVRFALSFLIRHLPAAGWHIYGAIALELAFFLQIFIAITIAIKLFFNIGQIKDEKRARRSSPIND